MKRSKYIIIAPIIIILFFGIVIVKRYFTQEKENQIELEHERQWQAEGQQENETHRRMVEDLKDINKTR